MVSGKEEERMGVRETESRKKLVSERSVYTCAHRYAVTAASQPGT